MFRLANPDTGRKVIQVSDKQGIESYAMLLTTETRRNNPTADPEIRFLETPAGAPMPVSAWWYAGESLGYEFIYPKDQLERLRGFASSDETAAAAEDAPGRVSEGEPVEAPPLADPAASPDVVEGEGVPAEADIETQVAQAETPAAQAPVDREPTATREELPQTASPLALLLLGGLVSASVGYRMLRS
jgi:hypothetical protein